MTLSFNEQLAHRAAAHAIDLVRLSESERQRVLAYLRQLEVRLEELLRAYRVTEGPRVERQLRLDTLLRQVRASVGEAYEDMASAQQGGLESLASAESALAAAPLRPVAIVAELGLNVLSDWQLRHLARNILIDGAPSRAWWEAQAGDLLERFTSEIREGYALGETVDDLVRRVRGRATGRRNLYEINGRERTFVEFRGGIMDTSTRNAEALVRTSVATVSADARRSTFEENQDVVKGVVQISTLDTRTTVQCIARASKAWSLPDYEPIDHSIAYAGGVPVHWGCRSTEAPLLRSWQELGIDLRDAPAGTRWSRLDGQVPGDFTFDDFFERRTAAQIEEQIGARAAELYRQGKLDLEDLISAASSQPLTVAELEAKAAA